MVSEELTTELNQKKQRVKELSAMISVWAMKPVSREVKGQEEDLQARMQFRLAELRARFEIAACDVKIKLMTELIDLLKSVQK